MSELRDPVSSVSHLLTAAWAVFATLVMLRLTTHRPGRRVPVLVYGTSMVLLFLASGTFHALHFQSPERRRLFQMLDKSAVYLLIAGTYTPIVAILLTGAWRKWILGVVWLIAVAGVACIWLLPEDPQKPDAVHAAIVGMYLGLGWIGILPLPLYYRAIGWRAMNWVWAGAGLYTLGAVCELTQWPVIVPGWFQAHEMLHVTHSAASLVFFLFVVRYVIPYQPKPRRGAAPVPHPEATADRQLSSPIAER